MRMPTSPVGSLMTEHRMIERMLAIMDDERKQIERGANIDCERVEVIVEFLATYADRNHHGKEEDILFKRVAEKNPSPEDDEVMQRLIQGHRDAREQVRKIRDANRVARRGDMPAIESIGQGLQSLIDFYPGHIEEEDHRFFKAAMGYFTREERAQIEEEFEDFDRLLLHTVYEDRLTALEQAADLAPATL